jgi:dTDP-4-dehydrorhamnose 3,5-epimerase
MNTQATALPGVFLVHSPPSGISRTALPSSLQPSASRAPATWAQISFEIARLNVIRGIHYQLASPQGRLVGAVLGKSLHIAIDLRRSSSWFGMYLAQLLTAEKGEMLWIPEGFGHAWMALTRCVAVVCGATSSDCSAARRTIAWNDPDLSIPWPSAPQNAILCDDDRRGASFRHAEVYP